MKTTKSTKASVRQAQEPTSRPLVELSRYDYARGAGDELVVELVPALVRVTMKKSYARQLLAGLPRAMPTDQEAEIRVDCPVEIVVDREATMKLVAALEDHT